MHKPLSSESRRRILVLVDFGLILTAVLISAILRHAQEENPTGKVLPGILVISLIVQLSFYYNNLYDLKATNNFVRLTFNLIHSFAVAAVILGATYLVFPQLIIARGVFFLTIGFVVLFVVSWRYAYIWILRRKGVGENILILGANGAASEIAKEILQRPHSGYHLVGFWSSNGAAPSVPKAVPVVFGKAARLLDWILEENINTIVVASREGEEKSAKPFLNEVQKEFPEIEVRRGAEFYEEVAGKVLLPALSPADIPPFRNAGNRRLVWHFKRLIDIVISLVGLALTLPVSILTAIAIKLTSRGPVFFSQERVGQNLKPFKLLKFRSMRENAEAESGPVWAGQNDARITRVGRIIRKFRIDEIPQMWNVLRGQMSFIGPRPERPCFVRQFEEEIPFYVYRHLIKPGITGLAQVRHYYTASMEETVGKLEYDLYYMKHMSPLYDFMILLDTVKTILFRAGAR